MKRSWPVRRDMADMATVGNPSECTEAIGMQNKTSAVSQSDSFSITRDGCGMVAILQKCIYIYIRLFFKGKKVF
jgi:hypothetical protein